MRCVKLAKELAEQLGKVEVVVDVGKEALVVRFVVLPVATLKVGTVELALYGFVHVVEHVGALGGMVNLYIGRKGNGLSVAVGYLYFGDTARCDHEEVLGLLVEHQRATTAVELNHQLGFVLTKLVHPEVVSALECGKVVELFAIGGNHVVGQV